jgi:hypothetical protein
MHHDAEIPRDVIPATPTPIKEPHEALDVSAWHDAPDLAGYYVYRGPYGARHVLRADFWDRVAIHMKAHGTLTDNDYVKYARHGKFFRIPGLLLEEFRLLVDEKWGSDHTKADADAVFP